MFQKHTLELLTEGQFGTIAVYFETATPPNASEYAMARDVQRRHPWAADVKFPADVSFPFVANSVPKQTYVYKVTPELHAQLAQGDSVVVPSSGKGAQQFSVGRVWMVHPTPQIDYDAPFEYKWIVQKIDSDLYIQQVAQEEKFRALLKDVQKAQERDKVRQSMLASVQHGGEAYQIFTQALASIGAPVPVQAPVPPIPPSA